jgi:transposase
MLAGFWLSDRAGAEIEPLLPTNQPGARLVDDRRVISGIIHVLRIGCRWEDWNLQCGIGDF